LHTISGFAFQVTKLLLTAHISPFNNQLFLFFADFRTFRLSDSPTNLNEQVKEAEKDFLKILCFNLHGKKKLMWSQIAATSPT
jgi:hypothetical protein